jgi:uncharacterized protein
MDLTDRQPGPDVVRALAMAGVVFMNYHGYLILRGAQRSGGWEYDLFDPWTGPLSTRFAATFVLTAGVAITLMTRSRTGVRDPQREDVMRWRLIRRGLLLYGFGLMFDFIWAGTILTYYGAMFVVAAALFTLRSRWILSVGIAAALAGWLIRWWQLERELDGHSTSWLTSPGGRSPRGLVIDVFINGTHPLLPWLVFLCAGIVLGRALGSAMWRPVTAAIGITLDIGATLANSAGTGSRSLIVLSNDPSDRGIAYSASALGTALLAFVAVSWVAERFATSRVVDALRRAGQMSLTIYIGHALIFNLAVDWLDVINPRGLPLALACAALYWITATAAAVRHQRRHGRGPAEQLYRQLTT